MFALTIDTDNDAFVGDTRLEVARILRQVADNLENDGVYATSGLSVRDFNGNTVGKWELT